MVMMMMNDDDDDDDDDGDGDGDGDDDDDDGDGDGDDDNADDADDADDDDDDDVVNNDDDHTTKLLPLTGDFTDKTGLLSFSLCRKYVAKSIVLFPADFAANDLISIPAGYFICHVPGIGRSCLKIHE